MRASVQAATGRLRRASAQSTSAIGARLCVRLGFLTLDMFAAHWQTLAAKAPGVKIVTVASPEGGELEGVLLHLSDISCIPAPLRDRGAFSSGINLE